MWNSRKQNARLFFYYSQHVVLFFAAQAGISLSCWLICGQPRSLHHSPVMHTLFFKLTSDLFASAGTEPAPWQVNTLRLPPPVSRGRHLCSTLNIFFKKNTCLWRFSEQISAPFRVPSTPGGVRSREPWDKKVKQLYFNLFQLTCAQANG